MSKIPVCFPIGSSVIFQWVSCFWLVKSLQWSKHQSYAAIIEDIRFYQQTHYNLARCEPLQRFLHEDMAEMVLSADEQYERSLEVEPRGAPAPPIANLSGKESTKSRGGGLNGLAEASLGIESSAKNLWREAKRGSAVIMSQVGQAMNNNL